MYDDPLLSLYDDQKDSFQWNNFEPIGLNIQRLLEDSFYGLQYPEIITAYALTPHRISLCLPILLLHGKEGTGKSKILSMIALIRGIYDIFNCGTITYPSIRNAIEAQRTLEGEPREGCILLLDNMHNSHLKVGEDIYNLLLTGYKRGGKSAIASEKRGEIIYFDTFCLKAITSIDSIHLDSSKRELQRRLLPIKINKVDSIFLNHLKEYDLSTINKHFYTFWSMQNYQKFVSIKREILKEFSLRKNDLSPLLQDKKELLTDVMTTAQMTIFNDLDKLFYCFNSYCTNCYQTKSELEQFIDEYLSMNNPEKIFIKQFKNYVESLRNHGIIDNSIKFESFKSILINQYDYKQNHDILERKNNDFQ
jgi:hypothetical protein